jgi:N-carbamoyl-L-amino-acid hydrolase
VGLRVDAARLRRDLDELSEIGRVSADSGGGISRTAYSAEDAQARQWYANRCVAAGLRVQLDGLGNMFARPAAADPSVPAVWTGSHIDTVPNGGPLDGALGVVAALECVRRITEAGLDLARPVNAVVFADEEGNYSGRLLGSYGLSHGYSLADLESMTGRDGDRVLDALAKWTWADGSPTGTRLEPGTMHSFVELHIEQGPRLDDSGHDIGVVTSIVGLCGATVSFVGRADHAGTTPMDVRQDALRAAADFLNRLAALATATGPSTVITCGRIAVEPGGANVVPRLATLSLDFRDPSHGNLDILRRRLEDEARAVAAAHAVALEWRTQPVVRPVPMDESIRATISAAADALSLRRADLPSGAGHDAQNMAQLAPTAMIFVPSKDGRSHSPAEHTEFAAIERGANVLLATLIRLASS